MKISKTMEFDLRNFKTLKNQVKNTYNTNEFLTVMDNIKDWKLWIVPEFLRCCLLGHSFYIALLNEFRLAPQKYCLIHKERKLAAALDLSGESLSYPSHPEAEMQALFIGCICFPSFEINNLWKNKFKCRTFFKRSFNASWQG